MDATVEPLSVNAQWMIDPAAQAAITNQLFIQFDSPGNPDSVVPDGAYLTFGHINPPVFNLPTGERPTPEMAAATTLPVVPVARVYCSLDRLKQFVVEIEAALERAEGKSQQ